MDLTLLEPIPQVRFQSILLAGVLWIRSLFKTKGTINFIVLPRFVRISQAHGWRKSKKAKRPLKCIWHKNFHKLIRKSFQNDEEWRLFYCDSTRGCRVIQDFDLCKLDDLCRRKVDTKWCKITKMEYLLRLFLWRPETLCSCYTHHKVPWLVYSDIFMATQWAVGPLHLKGKIRVSLLQGVLFAFMFIQWVWTNIDIT